MIINRYKAEKQPVLQAFNQAFCAASQQGYRRGINDMVILLI